jgi:hypothetical protein
VVVVHTGGVVSGGEGGTAITAEFSPPVGFDAGVVAAAPPVPELALPPPELALPPDEPALPVEAPLEQVPDTLG